MNCPSHTLNVNFIDDEIDDAEVTKLTAEEIAQCDDIRELRKWYNTIVAIKGNIKADIAARLAIGDADDLWLWRVSGKLGFLGRAETRLTRRLKALGHDPVWHDTVAPGFHRALAVAKAEASYGREYVLAAQSLLSADYLDEIPRRAIAAMEAASAKKSGAAR